MKENFIKTYPNKYLMFKEFPKVELYSIRDIFIDHWSDFCKYAEENINYVLRYCGRPLLQLQKY